VAEKSAFVRIDAAALHSYAASLPPDELILPQMDPAIHYLGHGRDTVAYFLTLDAVNFGSGYFPDIFGDRESRDIATSLQHLRVLRRSWPDSPGGIVPADCG
jgi:hypothetical protein